MQAIAFLAVGLLFVSAIIGFIVLGRARANALKQGSDFEGAMRLGRSGFEFSIRLGRRDAGLEVAAESPASPRSFASDARKDEGQHIAQ